MKQADLIKHLAGGTGITQQQARDALELLAAEISGSMHRGEKFTLPGVGVFTPVDKEATTARNPRTGDTV